MAKPTKITKSARGKDCTIRIPGVCNFDNSTVVHCHKNGGGMGMKANDILGARGCSKCHSAVDGAIKTEFSHDELLAMFYEGIFRTQLQLIDEGLIEVK
jgi:hypothetical protein